MTNYKSYRIIDKRPKKVIVDETGKIVNINPRKDELNNIKEEPNKNQRKKKYTDEELLNYLREFEENNGRIPVDDDFHADFKYPSVWNYHTRFGSWSRALKLAGLHANSLTDDELLGYLRQFYNENKRIPENTDFVNNKYPSYSTYRRRFGTWNKAIELSGLLRKPNYIYTDDELLGYLRQFYNENGKIPMNVDFVNNDKYPGYSVYCKRFGSWNNAIKIAGLQHNRFTKMSDNEMLDMLRQFYNENIRPPVISDFVNNHKYPSFVTYQKRFGSWSKALMLVGLDVDTISTNGILETTQQKGRFLEIIIREHFTDKSIDLAGENCLNPFDGICPKGQNYEVKSASLIKLSWTFTIHNIYKEEIEWFYLGAFNDNYTKLLHVWRIPGDFIDGNSITIGIKHNYTYNIENMKEFDIIDKFKDIHIGPSDLQ